MSTDDDALIQWGRECYILSLDKVVDTNERRRYWENAVFTYTSSLEEVERLFRIGWEQQAEEVSRAGTTRFYLQHLYAMMQNEHGDWYGTGFDEPMRMVQMALRGLDELEQK